MEACFKSFDKDEDNAMNINEFTALIKALFRNEKGKPYPIDPYMITEIFNIFNKSGDGSISKEEFAYCWNNWIKKIVRPISALLVIDVQNDFISGSLAITNCPAGQDGEEVVAPINKLIETTPFDIICYSLDWHPQDHISFVENVGMRALDPSSSITNPSHAKVGDTVVFTGPPKTEQKLWPAHCVQESWGSEFHKDLIIHPQAEIVHKGINPNIDSYSAFFDNQKLGQTNMCDILKSAGVTDVYVCGIATDVCVGNSVVEKMHKIVTSKITKDCLMIYKGAESDIDSYSSFFDNQKLRETKLRSELEKRGVTDVYVCGLATDVCVASTTFHALELGFRTVLVDDCSRGIDDNDIKCAYGRIREANGLVVQSSEVRAMVQGRDRRVELGYQWAIELRKNIIYPPKNKNSKYNPVIPDVSPNASTDAAGQQAAEPEAAGQQEVAASA